MPATAVTDDRSTFAKLNGHGFSEGVLLNS